MLFLYFKLRPWLGWLILGGFLFAFLAVGVFLIAPKIPAVRNWRADQLAKQSLAAIEAGEWEKAGRAARSAYQISRTRVLPIRAAAHLNAAAAHPQTLDFFRHLSAHPDSTLDDKLAHAEIAIQAGEYREANEILENLPEDTNPTILSIRGKLALATGQTLQAIQYLEAAVQANPTSNSRLELGLARLVLDDPNQRADAVNDLIALGEEDPAFAPLAASAILGDPRAVQSIDENTLSRLMALSGSDYASKAALAAREINLSPSEADEILAELRAQATDGEKRRAFARLLLSLGRNEEVLEVLPLASARSNKGDLLLWLDAMAALEKWHEILNILEDPQSPLEPALVRLFMGRAKQELGQHQSANADFEASSRLPTQNPTTLLYIAGYLHQIGQIDHAAFILERLEKDPLTARVAAEALVNIHRTRGDSEKLTKQLEKMRRRWPGDAAVINDLSYLRLLRREKLAESLHDAGQLVEEDPDSFAPRITLALAMARQGNPAEGLRIFEGSEVRLEQLLPFQRAIFAGLLRRNGMISAADSVLATIPNPAGLLPEERAFAEFTR